MLLQTNSYIVPKDKRPQHHRLVQRFRQSLARLGCDHFEAYEQVGENWSPAGATGRFVQLMRFRDRKHQLAVQAAERKDPTAQALIKEFCELINFPYQQQQGLFAVGFYNSLLPTFTPRAASNADAAVEPELDAAAETLEQNENPPEELDASLPELHIPVAASSDAIEEPADESLDEPLPSLIAAEAEDNSTEGQPQEVDADADALLDEMESSEEPVDPDASALDITEERNPQATHQNEPG